MTTTPALRRFLRYVSFDTQSSTQTGTHPSTPGQLALAGVPGGDGADGLGAGGGGSGFGTAGTARGGYGGCGTVIVAYDLRPAGTVILVK